MAPSPLTIPVATFSSGELLPETRCYNIAPSGDFTPQSLAQEIERAANAGFNCILFPIYLNGYTCFTSAEARSRGFAPVSPVFKKWDPLALVAELTRQAGLGLWGFARPYNFHSRYSLTPHRLLDKFPGWRARIHPRFRRHELRKREQYAACPINPEYRRYFGDLMTEAIAAYPLEAVVVNYTGYALRQGPIAAHPFCFCRACRERWRESKPDDLLAAALDPAREHEIRAWQTEQSHAALDYLRHRLLTVRRTLRVIARVQPQWRWAQEDSDSGGQTSFSLDWTQMIETGAVEELLVDHDDERDGDLFRTRLVSDLAYLHDEALLLPAVAVRVAEDLAGPVAAIRRYPVAGLMAEFESPITDEQVAEIRARFFPDEARPAGDHPLLAVAFLLRRVQRNHSDNALIRDFMRDFLRLIEVQVRQGSEFDMLRIILENLGGLQAAIRRGRLGKYQIPESTLRELALARKIIRLACFDVRS